MPFPKKIQWTPWNIIKMFIAAFIFIGGGSYLSFFDGVDKVKTILDSEKVISQLYTEFETYQTSVVLKDAEQDSIIKHLEFRGRMFYEALRALTDNNDSLHLVYENYIELKNGKQYDVDWRLNNELFNMAFVKGYWLWFPIVLDSDGASYILHNEMYLQDNEEKSKYIIKK